MTDFDENGHGQGKTQPKDMSVVIPQIEMQRQNKNREEKHNKASQNGRTISECEICVQLEYQKNRTEEIMK